MNIIQIVTLIAMMTLAGCMVPAEADFMSAKKPLSSEELIVNWRFPRYADKVEVLDSSRTYAGEMEHYMDPLFQQVIRQIFADVKSGKLTMREESDITNLEEEIMTDLPKKMSECSDGSWQNLGPFMRVFHITQRRKVPASGFQAMELELELICKDPENQMPERILGSVRVTDLIELGYTVSVGGTKYSLGSYLEKGMKYAYPLQFIGTEKEIGMYTLEQAFFTKERLLSGGWNTIEWLGEEPNQSSLSFSALPESELMALEGNYVFEPGQGSFLTKGPIQIGVVVTMEKDHLIAKWSNQNYYHHYLIFPSTENRFFTPHGDQVKFISQPDGKLEMAIVTSDGAKIVGHRGAN